MNPANVLIYANMGDIEASRGDWARAIEYYRRAVEVEPGLADAHERLGRLLIQDGRREEAIKHLEEAVRILKSGSPTSTNGQVDKTMG